MSPRILCSRVRQNAGRSIDRPHSGEVRLQKPEKGFAESEKEFRILSRCLNSVLSGSEFVVRMSRFRGLIASLWALGVVGCASAERQVSDLSAPAAPRLTWQVAQKSEQPTKAPLAQDLVIREHRFVSHSAQLNSDGEDQVQRLATCLRASPAKITIEPSDGTPVLPATLSGTSVKPEKLDMERRRYVIQKLLTLGIPDAEARVVLQASPEA